MHFQSDPDKFNIMQTDQKAVLEKRLRKLKEENQSLRDRMTSLKGENKELRRDLRIREGLFNLFPAGIILVQQGKIVQLNERLQEQLGYQTDKLPGRYLLELVHPDYKANVRKLHTRWASGKGIPSQYEAALLTRGGETIPFDVAVQRVRYRNRTALLLCLTGLEKRKALEREELRAKNMEAFISMASYLASKFGHTFESVIEKIEALRDIADNENNAVAEGLKEIEHTSKKGWSITRKLDLISRTEQDRDGTVSFDISGVVREAIASVDPEWDGTPEDPDMKIELKSYLRSSSLIEGDPGEIRGAVISMIRNAIEAMPEGGDIYLTTEDNAGYAHIYIQDSGTGIPVHIRDRIFDPCFTTRGGDAMGLGLSIAYAAVKRRGGDIELSSKVGQGTIFTISLPLANREERKVPRIDPGKIRKARVLIIQDEDIIRELLSQLLTNKGCRTDTASNGLEGLGKLKKKKFNLVIADAGTPDVNGDAFVGRSRKIDRKLAVALITGNEGIDSLDHAGESAADLVITKPIDVNKVVRQVSELLTARR